MDHIVDARDSRCIKAATDKFPPTKRKKRPSPGGTGECREWNRSLVIPQSISLGGRGSSRSRGRVAEMPRAPSTRVYVRTYAQTWDDSGLISSHWSTLTRPPRGTMRRGLHIVVYIYASRHKSSFKSHSAAIRWEHTRARAPQTRTHIYSHTGLLACERSASMVRHG